MSFKCFDCGNTSSKSFPGGACPACDSFNVRSSQVVDSSKAKVKTSKEKKAVLVLFWALFLFGLWENYLQKWLEN